MLPGPSRTLLAVLPIVISALLLAQTPQQPTFRAGTDLISIEAQVVGKDSTPT